MASSSLLATLIPAARLARYRSLAGPKDDDVESLYLWQQELAHGLFADIAALEVAMRSAMARELAAVYGQWYKRTDLFDDDTTKVISNAWGQNGLQTLEDAPGVTPDAVEAKLVSGLMFGFWVLLLGKGSYSGRAPYRVRREYSSLLWNPALANAFPYAPVGTGAHVPSRTATERLAFVVRAVRNRIAHHEHVAWGLAVPGQTVTLTVTEVIERLFTLAGYIDPDIESWIRDHSRVAGLVASCPVTSPELKL